MSGSLLDTDGFGGRPDSAAQAVNLLKALSHEGRLQILCLLLDQDLSVGALADALGLHQASASQQLMRLRAEGFVASRREGKMVIYHLLRQDVKPVIAALRDTFCAQPNPPRSPG
ncbi:metalloregulator ArsR/SmtB family transcription factor [bacterium]|nr:metalloregulator ArsR/SmtB family transcription factor [bacterium]